MNSLKFWTFFFSGKVNILDLELILKCLYFLARLKEHMKDKLVSLLEPVGVWLNESTDFMLIQYIDIMGLIVCIEYIKTHG